MKRGGKNKIEFLEVNMAVHRRRNRGGQGGHGPPSFFRGGPGVHLAPPLPHTSQSWYLRICKLESPTMGENIPK